MNKQWQTSNPSKSRAIRQNRVTKLFENIEYGLPMLQILKDYEIHVLFLPFFEDAIGYKKPDWTAQEQDDWDSFCECLDNARKIPSERG